MDSDSIQSRDGFDSRFSARRFLLILAGIIFATYPGLILGTQAFCYRDAGLFSYPVAYFVRDSYLHGRMPLWNMYNDCGIPFLAQWNTLALYPPSLLYVLLPMPWALNCFLLGHLLFGGLGMYRLAHRWFGKQFAASVAGLVFAWNGLSIHCLMWPCHTAGLAWMPWVVYLADRAIKDGKQWRVWAALAAGCQLLTGSPETIFLTWVIMFTAAAVQFVRNPAERVSIILRMLLFCGFAVGLAAIQLLPFLDLVQHGDRTVAAGTGLWSLPAWGLANFFVPLFHSTPSVSGVFTQNEQQWTSSYYIGVWPLAFAVIGLMKKASPYRIWLGALAVIGIFLAFGDRGFLLPPLKKALPFFGLVRFPIKFIILTTFCLTVLSGAGVAWLQDQAFAPALRLVKKSALILALAVIGVVAVERLFPFPADRWSDVWPNALGRGVFLAVVAWLLAMLLKYSSPRAKTWLGTLLLISLGLDICIHEPQQNPSVPASAYDARSVALSPIPVPGQSRAMLAPETERMMDNLVHPDLAQLYTRQRMQLFSDCNLLDGVPIVGGFMSVHPAEEHKVAELLRSRKASTGVVEFLGVSQYAPLEPLFAWFRQTNYLPWATIGQQPVFLDDKNTLDALCSANFDPRKMVFLPLAAKQSILVGEEPHAKIVSSHFEPNTSIIETSAVRQTMLVVAQTFYHDWQARVDGSRVPLLRANHGFQAVEVPAGQHTVRLDYVDTCFHTGAAISIVSLVACLLLLLRERAVKQI